MQRKQNRSNSRAGSRREFLKLGGRLTAGAALPSAIRVKAYAGEDNTIKIGLVGMWGPRNRRGGQRPGHAGPDEALRPGRRVRLPRPGQPQEPLKAVQR